MSGIVIVGGTYFIDERIKFPVDGEWKTIYPKWQNINGMVSEKEDCDWYFVFGVKKWVRRLKKAGVKYSKIARTIANYLLLNTPKVPMGILDDNNLDDEVGVGDSLRKIVFEEFNCKVFLLREYLKGKQYDKRVIPFSICSQDWSLYGSPDNVRDLYFCGDLSGKDRKKHISKLLKYQLVSSYLKIYKGGEHSKYKVKFTEYLDEIGKSRVCLSFAGHGYCTFRYQEIPAVGSVMATPEYPWVVRNDYRHLEHCIKYKDASEIIPFLKEKNRLEEMAQSAHEHFMKHHVTQVRYNEWIEYLDEIR